MRENVEIEEAQIVELYEPLRSEAFQQQLTEQAEAVLFDGENGAVNTARTVNDFVDDYLQNGRSQAIDTWLIGRFSRYPEIWADEQEKIDTAHTIIGTVEALVANQVAVEKHLNAGKTLANFLNKKIEAVAKAENLSADEIAQGIDEGLNKANQAFTELYTGTAMDLNPVETVQKGLDLARHISKRSEMNANLNLAWYGAKSIGSRLWKAAMGQENLSRAEELTKIIRGAVESTENKGVQVAVSGGMVVSAKKGWLKGVFDGVEAVEKGIERTRTFLDKVQNLTLNIAEGWNDVRIFDQVERGLKKSVDVVAEKAKFATAKLATKVEKGAELWCRKAGAKAGQWLGTTVGALINPAAAAIGGQVGAVVGDLCGKVVSDKVVKPVVEVAKKVADKVIDTVADTVKKVASKTVEVAKKAWTAVKESKLNPFNWF
ncbi:hypothetical protein B0187_09865 [Haemophilus paracuniculus]|uniref:Uncharacterized protein n=1 Tax=Haemophilus paracuniculus TaxID=734 RepID=A0A1T0APT2_9PAST|nr:hypothetical protein [Haemophilus paracuniculus]OOR97998.1 hypothetical protein B0187_09865 [Haemophilus paracuniculus]